MSGLSREAGAPVEEAGAPDVPGGQTGAPDMSVGNTGAPDGETPDGVAARRAGGSWPAGRLLAAVAHQTLRAVPVPAGAGRARALVRRNMTAWRHALTTLISGFFEPVFYLFSMGLGLGRLVGTVDAGGGHQVRYALFVAPALLAASAMNGAVFDTTGNIFYKLHYLRLYDAVLATPLGPRDIAVGEVSWALLRGTGYAASFLLVMALAGMVTSWTALLALPAAVVIGLCFAGVGMAAATVMRSWQDFDLVQLVMLPMFLFSGTFAPVSSYPPVVRWVVRALPLSHAVELVRGLVLGVIGPGLLVHLAYLVGMGLVGMLLAARRLERTLLR